MSVGTYFNVDRYTRYQIENQMNEIATIRRQITLKRQARKVIKNEIVDLWIRLAIITLKGRLEVQMKKDFDPELSKKMDAVIVLLEE